MVAIIKEHGGDYGLQKLFGTAGAIIFGPLAGKIIDLCSDGELENYDFVFYLYFALRLVTSVIILKLCLNFKSPAKKVFKDVGKVLKRLEVVAFITAFFFAGIFWGFLENFLFW